MDTKRTEKLVSALYLLTSFFDEKEPMKWRLRELGSNLIAKSESNKLVLEITSLLAVGKNAGLISDTNFEIIHSEFSKLLPESSIDDLLKQGIDLPAERVSIPKKLESKPDYTVPAIADRPEVKEKPKASVPMTFKKNTRQNTIIGLLKKKKEIMIKDVSPLIPGVSEKTIQRELLSMVGAGILHKIGEKRWSRYTLAE